MSGDEARERDLCRPDETPPVEWFGRTDVRHAYGLAGAPEELREFYERDRLAKLREEVRRKGEMFRERAGISPDELAGLLPREETKAPEGVPPAPPEIILGGGL